MFTKIGSQEFSMDIYRIVQRLNVTDTRSWMRCVGFTMLYTV